LEYLEKIFQVPFALPPMKPDGLKGMLEGLLRTEDVAREPVAEVDVSGTTPTLSPEPDPALDPAPNSGTAADPVAGQPPPDPDPPARQITPPLPATVPGWRTLPSRLDLGPAEIEYIAALAPLVRTPRAAKRLANTYRILRSAGEIATVSSFLGTDDEPGEFQVVADMLAIVTAAPRLYAELCWGVERHSFRRSLMASDEDELWPALLNRYRGDPTMPVSDPAAAFEYVQGWSELGDALFDERLVGLRRPDIRVREAQKWASVVARFSFLPALAEPSGPPHPGGRTGIAGSP
jgi:hypothetical protein